MMAMRRLLAVSAVLALLLVGLPALVPAAQAQGGGAPYEVTDPSGDVVIQAAGQEVPVPAAAGPAATDGGDLTAFRIIEDTEERLVFETEFVDLKAAHTNTEGSFQAYLHVWFRVDGSPVWYHLIIRGIAPGYANAAEPSTARNLFAEFCITAEEEPFDSFGFIFDCYYQEAYCRVYYDENMVRVGIPKLAILGLTSDNGQRPAGIPKALPAGSGIVDLKVEYVKPPDWVFFSFSGEEEAAAVDSIPDDGAAPVYELATPAADAVIRITPETQVGYPQGFDWDPLLDPPMFEVGVAEGIPVALPLHVENRGDAKRLVNLTARLAGGGTFDLKLAPTLEVPAGDSRKVTLLIEPKGSVSYGAGPIVEVRGVALGHPNEISVSRIQVIGTQPPTPERPTLHFHGADTSEGYTEAGPFDICLTYCYVSYRSWVSTLVDDPDGASDEEGVDGTYFFFGVGGTENIVFARGFGLDAPLAADLAFGSDPVDASLTFTADADLDGQVVLYLYAMARSEECDRAGGCMDRVLIGEGRGPVTATVDGGTADLSFVLAPEANDLDLRGGSLNAEVLVEVAGTAEAFAARYMNVKLIPAESSFTLPLVEPEEDASLLPSFVHLYAAGGAEEFVNPGKTKAFNVLVVNEGVEDSLVRLDSLAPDGWDSQMHPAKKYQLKPGESVNVTVLVAAPSNATEGETAHIAVDAHLMAQEEEVKVDSVKLRAITTEGVDIDDESTNYATDPDAAERAVNEEGGDSPALGLIAFVAAAAGGLALHRRRPQS